MRIFTFLAGAAVGYVLGTRAGREQYDQLRGKVQDLWQDPRTQEKLNDVESAIKDKAPDVGAAAASAAGTVAGKVKDTASSALHRATSDNGSKGASGTSPHASDHVSDPSLGAAGDTSDWSDEGGATPTGPSAVQ